MRARGSVAVRQVELVERLVLDYLDGRWPGAPPESEELPELEKYYFRDATFRRGWICYMEGGRLHFGPSHPSSKLRIILFYVAGIYDSSTQDTRQDTIYRLIPDKAEGLQRCSRSVWAYAEGDRRRLGAGVLQGGGGAFPDSERGVLP